MHPRLLLVALWATLLSTAVAPLAAGWGPGAAVTQGSAGEQAGNVLLVILDDAGVDKIGAYGEHPRPAKTPVIDALAQRGVLFRTVWANPFCSPTRATLMTGRYGFRTGIGAVVSPLSFTPGLFLDELCLPEAVAQVGGYRSALVGKWHLGGFTDGDDHARESGFALFAGSLGNLSPVDDPSSFYRWDKTINGQTQKRLRYATSDTVDDALRVAQAWRDSPWLMVVSFNAAHKPFHSPPAQLHSEDLFGDPDARPHAHHRAMTEAMDAELGRLLAGLEDPELERTHVLVIGDNGTQGVATEAPFDPQHGKGTLFDGGLRVPLIVAGPAVDQPGTECSALVNSTDLFQTCVDLAGGGLPVDPDLPRDSISLLPYLANPALPSLRSRIYAERFKPNHTQGDARRAMRGPRFKLIQRINAGVEELYDLQLDPFEQNDLMQAPLSPEARAALRSLRLDLAALLAS